MTLHHNSHAFLWLPLEKVEASSSCRDELRLMSIGVWSLVRLDMKAATLAHVLHACWRIARRNTNARDIWLLLAIAIIH